MTTSGESTDSGAPVDQTGGGGAYPTSPLFRKQDWWVQDCSIATARRLVEEYHYAEGGSNTRVCTHGLYARGQQGVIYPAVGVAWWIPPTKAAALAAYPKKWQGVLALSRLVVVPGVPTNACSFLIRHSMRMIDRYRWPLLLTYADEWRGHGGTIYLAAGWTFTGYTKPERCYTLRGRMLNRKAGPKTYTHAEMLARGCTLEGVFRKKRFVHLMEKRSWKN